MRETSNWAGRKERKEGRKSRETEGKRMDGKVDDKQLLAAFVKGQKSSTVRPALNVTSVDMVEMFTLTDWHCTTKHSFYLRRSYAGQ